MLTLLQGLRGHVDVDSLAPFDRDFNKKIKILLHNIYIYIYIYIQYTTAKVRKLNPTKN